MSRGQRRDFQPREPLCHQGDGSTHVLLLLEGVAKVGAVTDSGYERILRFMKPGEAVGVEGALDGKERAATVTALRKCRTLIVSDMHFRAFLAEHPEAATSLVRELTKSLRSADRTRAAEASSTGIQRLAHALLKLSEEYGEPSPSGHVRISLPLSQQEIASYIGTSREAVARAIRQLRSNEIINTSYREIVILSSAELKTIADGVYQLNL
ncbi:Crp/Fnr family transcriptional regulator [Streptomyces globisporus]|uniref:Crp/Fnr family transcriptional regulator n=1 Tax=Streptomyces globisporus TaxID=1908 RepID=UPI00365860EA